MSLPRALAALPACLLGLGLALPAAAQVVVQPNILQPRNSIILESGTASPQILRQFQAGTVQRHAVDPNMRPEIRHRPPVIMCVRAPCPQEPMPRPQPLPGPQEVSILMPVQFAYDSSNLNARARRMLDEVAQAMRDPSMRGERFLVEGHTDSTGSWAYNQQLSERRAGAAAGYLISQGVPAESLIVVGYSWGRLLPTAAPQDPQNRRVEIGRLAR